MMAGIRHYWTATLLAFMACYLCLAQPGMCPYWMIGDVSTLSATPTGGEHAHHQAQHNHSQQRDFFLATTAPALPQVTLTAAALLALLAAAALQMSVIERRVTVVAWRPLPLFPPPRLVRAS
jgi:hypothetical protein